jgi:hypothetical protein
VADVNAWQNVLVALIVVAAAVSAAWRLVSAQTRLRGLEGLLRLTGERGLLARALRHLANTQRAALQAAGCGGCAGHKDP